jgi:uroporphyrin-III C-methyltransferase
VRLDCNENVTSSATPLVALDPGASYTIEADAFASFPSSPQYISSLDPSPSLVCVTDSILDASSSTSATTSSKARRSLASLHSIRDACTSLRLPLNISDHPSLSDFSFPSTHRFPLTAPGEKGMSSLQIAVSTSGRGCRLANRIKREVVSRLPKGVGSAVDNVGRLRERARVGAPRAGAAKGISSCSPSRPGLKSKKSSFLVDKKPNHFFRQQLIESSHLEVTDEDLPTTPHIPLNSPVPQLDSPSLHSNFSYPSVASGSFFPPSTASPPTDSAEEDEEETKRRMRWVAQVSEYWPIEYLAGLKEDDMDSILGRYASKGIVDEGFSEGVSERPVEGSGSTSTAAPPSSLNGPSSHPLAVSSFTPASPPPTDDPSPSTTHSLTVRPASPPPSLKKGTIHLVGSGPGHPSLLTVAAHKSLLSATLILSDKLVPSAILALIPPTTTLHIAKKFPGNAEGAQNEMMALALEGARRGERVVRLKQGDPYVYGRGGEEVLFFREHGFESVVVPGVSSALAGPLMFGVPVTQRGVAESMVLCTGVGRKGKSVQLPGYERGRTLLVLMGVARITSVLKVLQQTSSSPSTSSETSPDGEQLSTSPDGNRLGPAYPPYTPIAIIERASSPDQRMIASTLEGIEAALDRVGDQRPPGMMVIGWSVLALEGKGDVAVLDDGMEGEEADRARVKRWLDGAEGGERGFIEREGLRDSWEEFL